MKTSYFTKIEDKYVFNLSLIFWHLFIALFSIAIVISLAVFLWSLTPAAKEKVEKQPYPEKMAYPEPVKVLLGELNLEEIKEIKISQDFPSVLPDTIAESVLPVENFEGKKEYEAMLDTLKLLIPPSKYSWEGSGYWSYPYGERYWIHYGQEKYRRWNTTEEGLMEKMERAYWNSEIDHYNEKRHFLSAVINVIKLIPEKDRLNVLQDLIANVADKIQQNINTYQAIALLAGKMQPVNYEWIKPISRFGKFNPLDGPPFIEYISTIINKFDVSARSSVIIGCIDSYYNQFDGIFGKQKESTDLLIPLLPQIKPEHQPKALTQYYKLYLNKNSERDVAIQQIEREYQQKVNIIEEQYTEDLTNSENQYENRKLKKSELRLKSLYGIGSGIIAIVLIATLLVFLSIQRSVRKIEESISLSQTKEK